ncbi:MAG TPA: type IV toxin-antitoxin system AbiEi family antitoxin [Longimicrobium sp.]
MGRGISVRSCPGLRGGSYLSHGSAAFLHDLASSEPDEIYVNKEQSPKPVARGTLTQEAIDRAFANQPRSSNYVFSYEQRRIVLTSGKQSGALGVSPVAVPFGPPLPATGPERTLVDLTVRPAYAGGPAEVLAAYRRAREKISVGEVLRILEMLQFVYPYHQAIGFYLERAGYSGSDLHRLRTAPRRFKFYLANRMADPKFDPAWYVYYPPELDQVDV